MLVKIKLNEGLPFGHLRLGQNGNSWRHPGAKILTIKA